MKFPAKILFALTILCSFLTFAGAGYVLINKVEINAGYACVPMILSLIFSNAYRISSKK